MDQYKL